MENVIQLPCLKDLIKEEEKDFYPEFPYKHLLPELEEAAWFLKSLEMFYY